MGSQDRTVHLQNTFSLQIEPAGNVHIVATIDRFAAELARGGEAIVAVAVTGRLPIEEATLGVARRVGAGGAMIDWVAEEFLLASDLELTVRPFAAMAPATFVVLTHDRAIFLANLARSEVIRSGRHEVLVVDDAPSATQGHRQALLAATNDLIIFVHHDVYLPPAWETQCAHAIAAVERRDPRWGVIGAAGARNENGSQRFLGSLFDGGVRRRWGVPWNLPAEVDVLDELLLITRKASAIPIDTDVPGFHGYGTQLCLAAAGIERKNYAALAECEHRSDSGRWEPDRAYYESHAAIAENWAASSYANMYGIIPDMLPADLKARVVERWRARRA